MFKFHSPSSFLFVPASLLLMAGQASAQVQQQKLLPSDLASNAEFGGALALDGTQALIGAPSKAVNGLNYAGEAYVFRLGAGGWTEEAQLQAPFPEIHDEFGTSVAIKDDIAVVGAPDFPASSFTGTGRAWVFRNVAGVWTQEAELLGSTALVDSAFGNSVATDGSTILVGLRTVSGGAVYVFDFDGSTWNETAQILPSSVGTFFGSQVAFQGDLALIAASYESVGAKILAGAVHVYRRTGTTWAEEAVVTDPFPEDNAFFGSVLAYDNGVLLSSGSGGTEVFVYRNAGTSWVYEQTLSMPLPAPITLFSQSLAVSGDIALVGAANMNYPQFASGGVFTYRWDGQDWANEAPFIPSDSKMDQGFGYQVALEGTTAFIGTWEDVGSATASGAAYAFDVTDSSNGFHLLFQPLPPQANEDLKIQAEAGTPFTPLFLVYSLAGTGSLYIPPLNVTLGLSNPVLFDALFTDGNGGATWDLVPDTSTVGLTFWFQALQKNRATPLVAMTGIL